MTPFVESDTWLVAVDDDPTGCQSVSGVPLLTAWDEQTLAIAARRCEPVTFVLTNSRSLPEAEAVAVNREVGSALARAALAECKHLRLISRSDSTLRGHFPAEVDALVDGAGIVPDGIVICPAFFEAGRFTADGIHWVHLNGQLLPACQTEFAADSTFGFNELTLADWARARSAPVDVIDIGLGELSEGASDSVCEKLVHAANGQAIVVNATNYQHLDVFFDAARRAEAQGTVLVYRTGPSFVRAAAGMGEPALADLVRPNGSRDRGLVVVGSHTELTNAQLASVQTAHDLLDVELDVVASLDGGRAAGAIAATAATVAGALSQGSVLLRTSRDVITTDGTRTPLEISRAVSHALTEVVRQVVASASVDWVVAKGGVTSHDLLVSAFGVRTAEVLGQALPGVIPVLEITVADRRLPFVIFPGNVGDESTLSRTLDRLAGS